MKSSILIFSIFLTNVAFSQETWRGLVVASENRCSPYDKKSQYPYPQSVEDTIVEIMGGKVYGPYTGRYFASDSETDIEHIVAASEGHDSGLCAASSSKRAQFATDPLNLTLAAPKVNRCSSTGKCGLDAGEWLPPKNQCWFANRIVQIKTKYSLTVNPQEAQALESVLSNCDNTDMIYFTEPNYQPNIAQPSEQAPSSHNNALTLYDENKNGRITCSEARAHGITPVTRQHPAYQYMIDRDGDGVVCEN